MNEGAGDIPRLTRGRPPACGRRRRARPSWTMDASASEGFRSVSDERPSDGLRASPSTEASALDRTESSTRRCRVRRRRAPMTLVLACALPGAAASHLRQARRPQEQPHNQHPQQQQNPQQSARRTARCNQHTWHASTERLNACTNSGDYPSAWDEPSEAEEHLFATGRACCRKRYPGQECAVIDACPETARGDADDGPPKPAPRPTRGPRTRKPKPTPRPTKPPTSRPTPAPRHFDWYVAYGVRTQCVLDCNDEPGRPCGGTKPAWAPSFKTADECCETISWIGRGACERTAPPTKRPTPNPTNLLGEAQEISTPAPTRHYDWYLHQAKQQCVQNCEHEPGHPCGGPAGQWAPLYRSAEECCASHWKDLGECEATAPPTSLAPTTAPPTMVHGEADAPEQPTKKPTPRPTGRPTHDCASPTWHLFNALDERSVCINDPNYELDGRTSHLLFSSAEHCCQSSYAAHSCQVVDVCHPQWYADYSNGWDEGTCTHINEGGGVVPKGRRTFENEVDCCLGGFLGQSSEACVLMMQAREVDA